MFLVGMSKSNPLEDRWFVQNTLPYIIPFLDTKDLLNVSKTSKLWGSIIHEYYLRNTFISICYEHIDNFFEEYGPNICRLQLVRQFKWNSRETPRPFQNKNTLKQLTSLTHFRFFSGFCQEPCWDSLLSMKRLKILEIGFHIPPNLGYGVLRHLRNLEVLTIHIYTDSDEHLFEAISNLKQLEELSVFKASVNEDLVKFLPTLCSIDRLAISVRAPCDTNYSLLLNTVAKLDPTLKHFCWFLSEVTLSDAFFGENCQRLFDLTNFTSGSKNILESCLSKFFTNTKVDIKSDVEIANVIDKYEKCLECCWPMY